MITTKEGSELQRSDPGTHGAMPRSAAGWWAIVLSVIGLGSWIILPLITINFRDTFPITDTALMPIIGIVLVDLAAAIDLLCVLRWKERSTLNIIALVITLPAALFFTFIVVGEALGGV
ncbi:hypothetical protein [Anaerosoma tenue]|uniref:hypothetical protein n=1 Tax=Anaerosoma tenue TaxID=2933588 RepID=UPI002260F303|nr:hypothetical protein [Anaerosoma tenue]MCK8113904.1 hypothetical protein [Anaerosoma tenue]